jgi:xanthine dehydrogenase accessory factor
LKDVRQILRFWQEKETSVLVTLVGTEGSSYRLPGAHLLLGKEGDRVGTISGGCLEATVVREAVWKIRKGAVVERYSTLFDDMSEMPFGSGCGGIVDLLMEPTGTPECQALMSAMDAALAGTESTALTWLPTETRGLARAILSSDGAVIFQSRHLGDDALKNARDDASGGLGKLPNAVFGKHLKSPQRLFIMGAGDDARPLSSVAALMGWTVIVMDGRSHLATSGRFPEADQVRVISSSGVTAKHIRHDDAVVLMTHSFEQDKDLLAAILPMQPRYLGLLGARRRSSLLVSEAAATLGLSVTECCDQVHAPIGLNLGGDGAEAIALAIVAEIQACLMGRLPSSRKLSPADVEKVASFGKPPAIQVAQCALDIA